MLLKFYHNVAVSVQLYAHKFVCCSVNTKTSATSEYSTQAETNRSDRFAVQVIQPAQQDGIALV